MAAEASSVKSAERTARILELLASSAAPLSVADLQDRTGYPRSSLHALLRTLRELRWVDAVERSSRFTVGPRALLVGTSYLDRDPALPHAYHVLEELRSQLGHTLHYARRDGAHVLYLASRESRDSVHLVRRAGRHLPAHATALGQALLAELTTDEVDEVLSYPLERFTENTITDRDQLHATLDAVRTRGWASEREQGTRGIVCVAVALGYRIPATDALSCSIRADLATPDEVARVAELLQERAHQLTTSLRRAGVR
ncbi:IclR family transcriptional regulator [Pseudactinotalea sp.]|uniref:IclR family transcriptional regulator n=1 Tax=Pseudactinotalea sp. TaxID=1926260 RepID=UPI003B3AF973